MPIFLSHLASRLRPFILAMLLASGFVLASLGQVSADERQPLIDFRPGDRIAIIGNALAERLQHDGWLETLLLNRFPRHQLVFRNLAFPGDELTLRLRSVNFGSPDQWLTQVKADVIFAFFGYNESFPGPAGLDKFKKDLDGFIKHTLGQKYGKTTPRLVLFSPIAHEDLKDPNLSDGKANNQRLALYTAAMAEVARANKVPFVDLFRPTLAQYAQAPLPFTINGIHLNEHGHEQVARIIDQALFPRAPEPKVETEAVEKLRQAVRDRNFYWFQRYRTVDGYSIYGGRADLKFVDGQTNRVVMQREMEILDVMTANRDKRTWAIAASRGRVAPSIDDSNTPPFLPVKTNKPGTGPGGAHLFLDGQDAIGKMTVARGMKVNLFASEKEFPELINPVQIAFDTKGRLWAAAWPSYPHWKPREEMNDQLLVLEDSDGDGKADKCTVFADKLHCPTGFEFYNGGVLVACAPDVWFLKDSDGDGKADVRVRVLNGIDSADTHCSFSNFVFDGGGALYMQEGTFHHTQVETPWGPPVRSANAGVFRYEPRTHKFELFIAHNFANVHGHAFDRWGQSFVNDATGAQTYHAALFSGHLAFPHRHPTPPSVYKPRTRPCPSIEILSSRHFPAANQGNLLVANVIGFQGILQYQLRDSPHPPSPPLNKGGTLPPLFKEGISPPLKEGTSPPLKEGTSPPLIKEETSPPLIKEETSPPLKEGTSPPLNKEETSPPLNKGGMGGVEGDGTSFTGTEVEPIVVSSDPNFRPADIKMGPEGAIYFSDWQNPIIGHMQHNLRDPSRDRTHGRIYRVTYAGRPLLTPAKIAGEPIANLLDLLKKPEDRTRYRTRIELGGRQSDQVLAAVPKWLAGLDQSDQEYEHHLLEALWLYQSHNSVNKDLLKRLLHSSDFRARAAAVRVLCYWRDRVPETLDLLKELAADAHPRVRLEAVRAASFLASPEAVEVPLISAEQPTDTFLDYVRGETMRALEPYWRKALATGGRIPFASEAGARFFLRQLSTEEVLKLSRDRFVFKELLLRKGVRDEVRREALTGLARATNTPELRLLLEVMRSQESAVRSQPLVDESVVFDLVRLLTSRSANDLAGVRPELEKMAVSAKQAVTRQLGLVALVAADGHADKAWALGQSSVMALRDLLTAIPLIRDPGVRASLYAKVEPLLQGLPKHLTAANTAQGTAGRYVRLEIPGKNRILTLAEVEVISDGRNVARLGKATQKNTGFGGVPQRAIDGNKSGRFGDGGQSTTQENTQDPWWEVDLGAEVSIDAIVIYNRTEGQFARRLEGFTLKILDAGRQVVFQKDRQPAPAERVSFAVGGSGPEGSIRRAAMNALVSIRGQEAAAFKTLARFVRDDIDRPAAIGALQRIPQGYWPAEETRPLLTSLLVHIRKLPAQERATPAALDALQLADALAGTLPVPEAKTIRRELGELGVRLLRLTTVPEQMIYDKERLVVKAGQTVEILFENTDLMPHNLVIAVPGSLEEIGNLAEATATQPGALERHYVPTSAKILLASRLLQPREVQKLTFTAPSKAGVYPYVCTYPGHWRRMHGALYVVADLDAYQADAEAYLARHPLPIADELLKFIRPRKEWKFEELAPAVEQLHHGRSFQQGKHLFQVASCVACHKMNGIGADLAPDLAKLDAKLKPADILKDILDPSFRINDKYQAWTIETHSGKLLTGLILEEKGDTLKLIENPLVKAEAVVLKKADIAERRKSAISVMPRGLLDKLTREEILDLLAYILSRGDARHGLFQGGHKHGHGGHGGH